MTISGAGRAVDKRPGLRRAAGMDVSLAEFGRRVQAVAEEFLVRHGQPAAAETAARLAARLAALVAERGLPRPLTPGATGSPGGLAESETAPLVARVAADTPGTLAEDLARQLVKACFYPELAVCRDSFREQTRDGACRRQEPARARGRISGSHCVDCPHWVRLDPAEHGAWLESQWLAGPAAFAAGREHFLPENFRALRTWLRAAAAR